MLKMLAALSVFMILMLGVDVSVALAYIGPGAGLSAIGSFFALIAAVVVAILGFLWYPFKRLLRNRKAKNLARKDVE